jgi:hypothetical protein
MPGEERAGRFVGPGVVGTGTVSGQIIAVLATHVLPSLPGGKRCITYATEGSSGGNERRHASVLNTYSPQPTSVLTAAVISATAFFASAKYMLVLGLAYSSLSMPA